MQSEITFLSCLETRLNIPNYSKMPIPSFDYNHVLPPHLGNPINLTDLSPYHCSILEVCNHFGTSKERIEILKGLVTFRQKMTENGVIYGFQWLDGSFLENIEVSEKRPPNDIDVVTFFGGMTKVEQVNLACKFPEFASAVLAKQNFKVDHYPFDYSYCPDATVEMTRYWIQLFTHNRNSIWKGILRIPINTLDDDQRALDYLNSLCKV